MGPVRATAALALALGLAAAGCPACSGDRGRSLSSAKKAPTATTTAGNLSAFGPCQPLPAEGTTPAWFPADLPLPDGSYAVGELAGAPPGFHKGVWAVKARLSDFVKRVALGDWRARGWRLGRGDSESGEADDDFRRGAEAGTFRARSVYCDAGWTELVVTFTTGAP